MMLSKQWLLLWIGLGLLSGCATYSIVMFDGVPVSKEVGRVYPSDQTTDKMLAKLYVNWKELGLLAVDGQKLDPKLSGFPGWLGLPAGEHQLAVNYKYALDNDRSETEPMTITASFQAGRRYLLISGLNNLPENVNVAALLIKRYEVRDITRLDDLVRLVENEESYITRSVYLSVLYSVAPANTAYSWLGQTSQTRDIKEKLALLNQVILQKPKLWVAYFLRAAVWTQTHTPEGTQAADQDLLRVLQLNPKCVSAYYELGKIHEQQEREQAIAYFKKAVDLGDVFSKYYLQKQFGIEYEGKK